MHRVHRVRLPLLYCLNVEALALRLRCIAAALLLRLPPVALALLVAAVGEGALLAEEDVVAVASFHCLALLDEVGELAVVPRDYTLLVGGRLRHVKLISADRDVDGRVNGRLARHPFFNDSHPLVLLDQQLFLPLNNLGEDIEGVTNIKHLLVNDFCEHVHLTVRVILDLLLPLLLLFFEDFCLLSKRNEIVKHNHLELAQLSILHRFIVIIQVNILLRQTLHKLIILPLQLLCLPHLGVEPLFGLVEDQGLVDEARCLSRDVDLIDGLGLVVVHLEDLRGDGHEEGQDDGAPDGGYHDYNAAFLGLGAVVAVADGRQCDHHEVHGAEEGRVQVCEVCGGHKALDLEDHEDEGEDYY